MVSPTDSDLSSEILSKVKSIFGKKKVEILKPIVDRIQDLKANLKYENLNSLDYRKAIDVCIAY